MESWIQSILPSGSLGLAALPAVFLLGILGALTSCCTLPVLGAVTGYAGSLGKQYNRRDLLLVGLFFMIGTTLSLAALGAVMGLMGQVAGAALGKYWRFAAGLLMVVIGLLSLNLLPFRVPKINFGGRFMTGGIGGAMLYGLVLGGAALACSAGCSPLLPMVLGATVLQQTAFMGMVLSSVFALGYSLPLAAGIVGIGFGMERLRHHAEAVMSVVRVCAALLLIGVGFYMLATV